MGLVSISDPGLPREDLTEDFRALMRTPNLHITELDLMVHKSNFTQFMILRDHFMLSLVGTSLSPDTS